MREFEFVKLGGGVFKFTSFALSLRMDRYYNIVNYVHGYSIQFLYCLASCASLVKMRTSINVCGMGEKNGVMLHVAGVVRR